MKQYHDYLNWILNSGVQKNDRTGVGTISAFGGRMEFDLQEGFPLVTTKKTHYQSVFAELAWMLRGDTNIKILHEWKCRIWDEWANENGDLGPVYGSQWRKWQVTSQAAELNQDPKTGILTVMKTSSVTQFRDQIAALESAIKKEPDNRRLVVSAWNVGELELMALPPCHVMFQCWVDTSKPPPDRTLSLQIYQRSVDSFLGLPFNVASYAALTELLAFRADLKPGRLIWVGGDCHIYLNHLEQVKKVLQRNPKPLPRLIIDGKCWASSLDAADPFWFDVLDYDPHPTIKAQVAV